jgi:hypothetical protein
MDQNKPHIFASAAETDLSQFKEQVPVKFKNKHWGTMRKEDLATDTICDPC